MNFEELMNCHPGNRNVFNDLVERIKVKSVVPFIGAGLSASLGYPTWTSLINELADKYGISKEIKQLIESESPQYEEAASLLEKRIVRHSFLLELKRIFGDELLKDRALPDYIRVIPHIWDGNIVTTNFDRVIETAFWKESIIIDNITPHSAREKNKTFRSNQQGLKLVIKLHGDIEDYEHLILTKSEYDKIYGKDNNAVNLRLTMPQMLKRILQSKMMLFLGCSLAYDRTLMVVKKCSDSDHFALVELPKKTFDIENPYLPKLKNGDTLLDEYDKKRRHLAEHRINCIWYPYGKHEALEVLLMELGSIFWQKKTSNTDTTEVFREKISECKKAYKERILKETQYVNFTGIPVSSDRTGVSNTPHLLLDKIYIKLQAISRKDKKQSNNEENKIPGEEKNGYIEIINRIGEYMYLKDSKNTDYDKCIDLHDILKKYDRIVILGGPGSGKSTLLRYVASKKCKEENEDNIPFLISLKEYAAFLSECKKHHKKSSFMDFAIARETDSNINEFMKKTLEGKNVLWLLDALDETGSYSEEIKNQVLEIPKEHKIILTSRPVGYDEGKLRELEHFEVLPLSPESIDQFFRDWYHETDTIDIEKQLKWMKNQLIERPQIHHLTKNPLLLTFLVILSGKHDSLNLPHTRSELYEKYIQELIMKWEDSDSKENHVLKEIIDDNKLIANKDTIKDILCNKLYEIGWILHRFYYDPLNKKEPSEKNVIEILTTSLTKDFGLNAKAIAKKILHFWVNIGMIERWAFGSKDCLNFRHISFQEFCSAKYMSFLYGSDKEKAVKFINFHFFLNEWREPIVMLGYYLKQELVNDLLNINDEFEQYVHTGACLSGLIIGESYEYDWDEEIVMSIFQILWNQRNFYSSFYSSINSLKVIGRTNKYVFQKLVEFAEIKDIDAIELLGEIGDISAVQVLKEALKDGEEDVRQRAAEALGEIGDISAVQALKEALKNDDKYVRNSAAVALEKIGDSSAVQTLKEALKDEDEYVRSWAVEALGKIGDISAVQALKEAIKDEDVHIRSSAAEALGKIGDSSAVQALKEALNDEDVRYSAAVALVKIGDSSAVQTLKEALNDEDEYVRSSAAEALGKIGDSSAVQTLKEALKDKDKYVRSSAAIALGKIGDSSAVQTLKEALKDEYKHARVSAAVALGKIGDSSAVQTLKEALKDEYEYVRSSAVKALGEIGDISAVQALKEALKDKDRYVRSSAVKALGEIGDISAVQALKEALKDKDRYVRGSAAEALKKIGDISAVQALKKALKDKDKYVRSSAAIALVKIGDISAVQTLKEALKDKDKYVRSSAAIALGKIGDISAIQALKEALNDEDEDVCSSAAEALGKIGDSSVVEALKEALKDEDSYIRHIASEALNLIIYKCRSEKLYTQNKNKINHQFRQRE